MLVLGIMSGTSVDGIDYALCEVTPKSVRLKKLSSREFPQSLRARLHAAAADQSSTYEVAQLHHDLGRLYARHAAQLKCGAELIALHGQTVFHNPDRRRPATLQIGEPAYLAEALRVPVASNFRAADMAAGGQGAPLATLFHQIVFAQRGKHVCVNNLGGISNVTSLDWRERANAAPAVLAFDTGPANVLIDVAMREFTRGKESFDRDGKWASAGRVHEPTLRRWLQHPFFRKPPPKSTGRELFGEPFWGDEQSKLAAAGLSPRDVVATLTEFTARSLAVNYHHHLPAPADVVVLCGGGAKNSHLVSRLGAALAKTNSSVRVMNSDQLGWPSNAIEPAAFALLGFYCWQKIPANLHTTTGARRAVILGQMTRHEE
jgi:anhydro-N-acetylmuramic acid kinase